MQTCLAPSAWQYALHAPAISPPKRAVHVLQLNTPAQRGYRHAIRRAYTQYKTATCSTELFRNAHFSDIQDAGNAVFPQKIEMETI